MIQDSRPRHDLTWLRHRSRRRPVPSAPPPAAAALPATSTTTGPADSDLDLSGPTTPARAVGADLDLSAPDPPRTPVPPPAPPATSPVPSAGSWGADLDLSAPGPAAAPPPAPGPPAPAESRSASRPPALARRDRRTRRGVPTLLTPREPTVTLDRLQSGVGALTAAAVLPPTAGDVVLGALYQLADGTSGAVGASVGVVGGPARSRRPVLSAPPPRSDAVVVDLRQSRSLRRLLVHATSSSARPFELDGTLVVTTAGGARVEVPLTTGRPVTSFAVLSLYAVDGEFVLRAELEPFHDHLREVAQAYGYRELSWADARIPVQ